jgi:hypothetical protein
MSDPAFSDGPRELEQGLEPVHTADRDHAAMPWTRRLVVFLRVMAVVSLLKGLYHWAHVTGIFVRPEDGFELHAVAWQASTVFFAVIDLVAAVGLWLAAAWGAVIWLTSVVSMIALDLFFPQVFDAGPVLDLVEFAVLVIYLLLALKSAQEQPS